MARSSKTTASKSRGGIKARGRPAKKTSDARKKTVSKTAAPRKRTSAKATASKSRASVGGGKARGRTAANTATKTASKRANHLASGARRRAHLAPRSRLEAGERSPQAEHDEERIPRHEDRLEAGERISQTEHDEERVKSGSAITNPVTEAMALGTEVVSGAILAGGEIVAATADMANSAARTAVAVTTGVVPDGSQESGSKRER